MTIAALQAGKHVMCEKPMAKTAVEARAMVEAAKATGKLLTIGYQNRYRSDVQYLHNVCRAGVGRDLFRQSPCAEKKRSAYLGRFLDAEAQGGGP